MGISIQNCQYEIEIEALSKISDDFEFEGVIREIRHERDLLKAAELKKYLTETLPTILEKVVKDLSRCHRLSLDIDLWGTTPFNLQEVIGKAADLLTSLPEETPNAG